MFFKSSIFGHFIFGHLRNSDTINQLIWRHIKIFTLEFQQLRCNWPNVDVFWMFGCVLITVHYFFWTWTLWKKYSNAIIKLRSSIFFVWSHRMTPSIRCVLVNDCVGFYQLHQTSLHASILQLNLKWRFF